MDDPRDFLMFARYGNLGVLLLGIGLLGILIHRRPARQAIAAGVSLLGILFLCQGSALLHNVTLSLRGSIACTLISGVACLIVVRSHLTRSDENKQAT
jgi:CHASE2 domain-containing sensor protein